MALRRPCHPGRQHHGGLLAERVTAQILDGRSASAAILDRLGNEVVEFVDEYGRSPALATALVGDASASHTYVRMREGRHTVAPDRARRDCHYRGAHQHEHGTFRRSWRRRHPSPASRARPHRRTRRVRKDRAGQGRRRSDPQSFVAMAFDECGFRRPRLAESWRC